MAGQAPSDLNNSNNITGPQLPVKLIQRNLVIFILGSTACTSAPLSSSTTVLFSLPNLFSGFDFRKWELFLLPRPLHTCPQLSDPDIWPDPATCGQLYSALDVNIDVNIKDLSNYSLTWPPHCKNRSQSALWVCAVLSLYSSLTWLSLMAIKVCRLSFDISYSNVFSLPDILYGISPWSRFKLVRYFIFRKTGGSGQRPCPWRRQPGSGCTSRPCQGESCLAGPALAVVHWSSQISLRSHLTSSTSISQLTYTFIIFCSAHQLLRK